MVKPPVCVTVVEANAIWGTQAELFPIIPMFSKYEEKCFPILFYLCIKCLFYQGNLYSHSLKVSWECFVCIFQDFTYKTLKMNSLQCFLKSPQRQDYKLHFVGDVGWYAMGKAGSMQEQPQCFLGELDPDPASVIDATHECFSVEHFPAHMLLILCIAELWLRACMLRAETLASGRWFFSDCACKVLFNTNYSKIWLWVSQLEDSEFASVPQCLVLSLLLPPVKWENAPLTQRGFVRRNQCDNDGSIQTSWWSEQGLNIALCIKGWTLSNKKRTTCWLAAHKLNAIQGVQWVRWVS